MANVPTASPSAAMTSSTPRLEAEKSPVSRDAVPAAEPEHDGKQEVVDADEDDGRSQARQSETEITVLADRVDGEGPGRETAERDVRDVERLDVPRVAGQRDRERDMQGDHKRDDGGAAAGRALRRPRTPVLRGCCGSGRPGHGRGARAAASGSRIANAPPLGLRRRISCNGNSCRDHRGKGDDGGVGGS